LLCSPIYRHPSIPTTQVHGPTETINLQSITCLLKPYLDTNSDIPNLERAIVVPPLASLCFNFPVLGFHNVHPGRCHGFGHARKGLSSNHDRPSPHLVWHFVWAFLTPNERFKLLQAFPVMEFYARLRRAAFLQRHNAIQVRRPRPAISDRPPLDRTRSWLAGCALLSLNFVYGDFIRWLGGEYTHAHRDWSALATLANEARENPPPPSHPPLDIDRALEVYANGAPIQGNFECKLDDMAARMRYNNHPQLASATAEVRAKFGKEEQNSYHMCLPRFLCRFISGLFLSPISWITRKEKGRIVIDASCMLHPKDTGAPNTYVPKAGSNNDECPAVHYGSSLSRHLSHIWNLRIMHPRSEILQHSDDIDAAFRRIIYHPEAAVAYAYVFEEFLMIPVGHTFGGRNSPSWFCLLAELRAHLGRIHTAFQSETNLPLSDTVELPPPISEAEAALIPAAAPDALNPGTLESDATPHNMFVDDNAVAATRDHIMAAIRAAEASAYAVFGSPGDDLRNPCITDDKWAAFAHYCITHLGYQICSRSMTVAWPCDKREALREIIDSHFQDQSKTLPLVQISKLLGLIRHGAFVFPLGIFFSIRLQQLLADCLARATNQQRKSSKFWRYTQLRLPHHTWRDLSILLRSLHDPHSTELWTRHIGLLVPRCPTHTALSDASYQGLGGWSSCFRYLWKLSREDLIKFGFPMHILDKNGEPGDQADPTKLHINVLEFVGVIINIWCALWCIQHEVGNIPGGVILQILADNTSALSWMHYAGRSHRTVVRNLAYFLQSLIVFSPASQFCSICRRHIKGKLNTEADKLSRPDENPSLVSIIAQCSQLQTCRHFQLPSRLVSEIANVISFQETAELSDETMTALRTLAPKISPPGATNMNSLPTCWHPSRRNKRSRR
jgi:hypothetical protein